MEREDLTAREDSRQWREREAEDRAFLSQSNRIALVSRPHAPRDIRQSLAQDEKANAVYQDALHALADGHDVRLDGDVKELALNWYGVVIVEDGEGVVEGRRVLAMAAPDAPGGWALNRHATPEQQAEIERLLMPPAPFDVVRMARDVAAVSYRMGAIYGMWNNHEFESFCATAGRMFHESTRDQRLPVPVAGSEDEKVRSQWQATYAQTLIAEFEQEKCFPSEDAMRFLAGQVIRESRAKQARSAAAKPPGSAYLPAPSVEPGEQAPFIRICG